MSPCRVGFLIFDKVNNVTSLDSIKELQARMGQSIIGQREVIDSLVLGLLTFLNKTGSTGIFTENNGKLLSDCSYQSTAKLTAFTREQVNGLHRAV